MKAVVAGKPFAHLFLRGRVDTEATVLARLTARAFDAAAVLDSDRVRPATERQ